MNTEVTYTTYHHMSANIEGILRLYKKRKIRFMEDDNGKTLSDADARQELYRLKSLGHKLLPCGNCDGFDPFGNGCPGHKKES